MSSFPYKRAIVILADGARPDVLNEEMARGNLVHLQELCAGGTNQTILTCFPSTTGPAYLPYLTGCHPGTCNIPGIRWFDKNHYARCGWGFKSFRSYCGLETMMLDGDLNPDIMTAWQVFKNGKSIFNGVTRGIGRRNDLTWGTRIWHYYYAHLTDRWGFIDEQACRRLKKNILDRDFEFVFVVFPSVDEFSHRSSPFHERVRQAYCNIDRLVGRLVADLETVGIKDETLIVLVSDHGLSETHTHFDIGPWLESHKKWRTLFYTDIFKFRFDAVSMVSGNGMAHLYFKGANGWQGRKTFEELSHDSLVLDELRLRREVDLVVTQGADRTIHFQTARGHGFFHHNEDSGLIHYRFDREDPLGLFDRNAAILQTGFDFDQGLKLTFDSAYPDIFYQMHRLFRSVRTGDVVVSARAGFDLRERFEHPIHKSSHGSIHPEHMRVPLIMNHAIKRDHIRSEDVFPTVLKLLNREIPQGIDGRCLV